MRLLVMVAVLAAAQVFGPRPSPTPRPTEPPPIPTPTRVLPTATPTALPPTPTVRPTAVPSAPPTPTPFAAPTPVPTVAPGAITHVWMVPGLAASVEMGDPVTVTVRPLFVPRSGRAPWLAIDGSGTARQVYVGIVTTTPVTR